MPILNMVVNIFIESFTKRNVNKQSNNYKASSQTRPSVFEYLMNIWKSHNEFVVIYINFPLIYLMKIACTGKTVDKHEHLDGVVS